jgi:hypothetical protein
VRHTCVLCCTGGQQRRRSTATTAAAPEPSTTRLFKCYCEQNCRLAALTDPPKTVVLSLRTALASFRLRFIAPVDRCTWQTHFGEAAERPPFGRRTPCDPVKHHFRARAADRPPAAAALSAVVDSPLTTSSHFSLVSARDRRSLEVHLPAFRVWYVAAAFPTLAARGIGSEVAAATVDNTQYCARVGEVDVRPDPLKRQLRWALLLHRHRRSRAHQLHAVYTARRL